MLTVRIFNDGTGDETTGNYRYTVAVNHRFIAYGAIRGHNRAEGWAALLCQLANEAKENNK